MLYRRLKLWHCYRGKPASAQHASIVFDGLGPGLGLRVFRMQLFAKNSSKSEERNLIHQSFSNATA